ncbi:uncharacterized protein B0T15DRAFT_262735 [Chaetomium strumarium]|uniref:Uncharacterized protein n=1 Tax=Chaetomium strumarium TaxID=1170767 RepID=A0AAJ0GN60_9PEZI|nr:hypothetical protein B0T15DRAFT_262735 [Chaetomium strumarium]
MKTRTLAVLCSVLVAATAHQGAISDPVAWYDPVRNATCTSTPGDRRIACQAGQVEGLLVPPASSTPPVDAARASHVETTNAIDTRGTNTQDDGDDDDGPGMCTGEGRTKNLGCFLHCFAQGFCTALCDGEKGACSCSCPDAPEGGVPCSGLEARKAVASHLIF